MTSLKKHILHLAQDEKFLDMGVNVFEKAYPQCNRLILVHKGKINHVTFENKNIITKKELVKKSKDSSFWKDVNTVIFHSLFTYNVTIPKGVKVIWLGFGFDVMDLDIFLFISSANSSFILASSISDCTRSLI